MNNLFSNRLNIFLIVFILIVFIYCLNIKKPYIENLDTNQNCIPVKNTNIVDSVNCNIKANNIWINNYKRRNNLCNNDKCSMNNYINKLKTTDKIGNYKISMKCDPVPECICNDNLRCAYVPDNNGNMKLQKICKVISNKMSNLLESSPEAVINNTPFYKIPTVCNYPDIQKGWYYQPNYKLDRVKAIYEKTPDINNICNQNKNIPQEENIVKPQRFNLK